VDAGGIDGWVVGGGEGAGGFGLGTGMPPIDGRTVLVVCGVVGLGMVADVGTSAGPGGTEEAAAVEGSGLFGAPDPDGCGGASCGVRGGPADGTGDGGEGSAGRDEATGAVVVPRFGLVVAVSAGTGTRVTGSVANVGSTSRPPHAPSAPSAATATSARGTSVV
jgi:hypothetical protein